MLGIVDKLGALGIPGRSDTDLVGDRCTALGQAPGSPLLSERFKHPRLVRIDDFRVDMAPQGTLLILRNQDVPGVIGRVGSLLGDAGINIAGYHQSRLDAGGDALAVVKVDARIDPSIVDALGALPEVHSVRQVRLDRG